MTTLLTTNQTVAASAVAFALVQGDSSVTRGMFNQATLEHVLVYLDEVKAAIPNAIECHQNAARDEAQAAAERLGLDEAAAADYVAVKQSLVPTKAAIESRLNQAARAAISRWHTGKASRPVWFDENLSLSFTDGFQWVPKPVRNQAAAAKKKADEAAAAQAKIEEAAAIRAEALLNDNSAVQAAAGIMAADMVDAAQSQAAAAQSQAAAAVHDKIEAQKTAQKAHDDVKRLNAEINHLKEIIGRLKRQNRILTAAVKNKKVLEEAAAIMVGLIEEEAAAA